MRKLQYFLFLFCLLANSLVFRLQATTIHVSAGGSIQSAINTTNVDTIMVAAGTYTENLTIRKNICLFSEDGAEKTIIDGNHNGSVLKLTWGTVNGIKVRGFTLMNGIGTPKSVNVPVLGAQTHNVGGGILCDSSSSAVLSDLIIQNNAANLGGGVFIYEGAIPNFQNCIIRNNNALLYGGGIWASNISNNGAGSSAITLTNTMICNNHSHNESGGIGANNSTKINIINGNIIYNDCDSTKGAAFWRANSSFINLTNCIVWGNNSTHLIYSAMGAGASSSVTYCDLEYANVLTGTGASYILSASNNISTPPLFYNIFHQNYHLTANSPCLGVGTSTNAPLFDIDNQARPLNGIIDIGADEFDATVKDITLKDTLSDLKLTDSVRYDYKPDGLGGMYAKYKLIVTYKDTTQPATKAAIRANCVGFLSYHVSLINPKMEEWKITKDVDAVFENLSGGTTANSPAPKPKGLDSLDKEAFCSGEILKKVLNFNTPSNHIVPISSPNDTLIAVLDGGIDPWNLALVNAIWRNPIAGAADTMGMNFIDNAYPYNICDNQLVANPLNGGKARGGHGTHVAGIIAETANLNTLNNHYKLLTVKVLDENGIGTSFSVYQGILYAIQKGVKMINLSLGYTGQPDRLIYDALDSAYKENIMVVAAAGNSHQNNDKVKCTNYPSSFNFSNIIAVGASDSSNSQLVASNYSNYANNKTACARSVDMFAHGRFSNLIPSYANGYSPTTTKGEKVGTSMAAAFVTGKGINELKIGTPLQNIKQNLIRLSSVSDGHLNDTISISGGSLLPSEQTNWRLPNTIETSSKEYIALESVILSQNVGGSYVVTSTANVKVEAGGAIVFKPGFMAQNTNFSAKPITIEEMFCPYEKPSFPARYASPVWVKYEQIVHQLENEEMIQTQEEVACRIYPNPFTEETNIEINLPNEGKVSVEVWNILGEKVSVLWKEEAKEMGIHTLTWVPTNVTQGVYFVKIYVNGTEIDTKKVLLL